MTLLPTQKWLVANTVGNYDILRQCFICNRPIKYKASRVKCITICNTNFIAHSLYFLSQMGAKITVTVSFKKVHTLSATKLI